MILFTRQNLAAALPYLVWLLVLALMVFGPVRTCGSDHRRAVPTEAERSAARVEMVAGLEAAVKKHGIPLPSGWPNKAAVRAQEIETFEALAKKHGIPLPPDWPKRIDLNP